MSKITRTVPHCDSPVLLRRQCPRPGLFLVSRRARAATANGYPVAYNASYMFYWLDRKGWNLPVEEHTVAKLHEYSQNGVRYFIGERQFMKDKPGFEDDARCGLSGHRRIGRFCAF